MTKLVALEFNILSWVEIIQQNFHSFGERRLVGVGLRHNSVDGECVEDVIEILTSVCQHDCFLVCVICDIVTDKDVTHLVQRMP